MSKKVFTSESVSEGHPDKVADQVSDAIVDALIAEDPNSRVACETLIKTGMVVVAGEVRTSASPDIEEIVRGTIADIGYDDMEIGFDASSCTFVNALGQQSTDIAMGVDESENHEQGAGDQGLMFGYASNETDSLMPAPIDYSHRLVKKQADARRSSLPFLRPDAKSQLTFSYDSEGKPTAIEAIVLSTQHNPEISQADLKEAVMEEIIKPVIPDNWMNKDTNVFINPTGQFIIGGPVGDCGLTGRKIIVDTYGGMARHGGGAFSGKDPSKVDRSAAYATRHIAKNCVAAGLADRMLVQVSYAIGVAKPMGVFVDTYGSAKINMTDGEIARKIENMDCFDLRPASIIERLKLKTPIYSDTAAYGHMGRKPETKTLTFTKSDKSFEVKVETFTWEKLDCVNEVKTSFGL